MSAPAAPGPDDSGALSSRERAALARMEDDLFTSDPDLAELMDRGSNVGAGTPSPISLKQAALLVPGLLVLVVTAALLPASWWAVLALLTGLVVVPWMLLCAIAPRSPG